MHVRVLMQFEEERAPRGLVRSHGKVSPVLTTLLRQLVRRTLLRQVPHGLSGGPRHNHATFGSMHVLTDSVRNGHVNTNVQVSHSNGTVLAL